MQSPIQRTGTNPALGPCSCESSLEIVRPCSSSLEEGASHVDPPPSLFSRTLGLVEGLKTRRARRLYAKIGALYPKSQDTRYLMELFSTDAVSEQQELIAKTTEILKANEGIIPGLLCGVPSSDQGFRGNRMRSPMLERGFREPHPESRRQAGHFLTAVDAGLGVSSHRLARTMLGVDADTSCEDFIIRLVVGHELVADPPPTFMGLLKIPAVFRRQYQAADAQSVGLFRKALMALGPNGADFKAADVYLKQLPIDPNQRGNSFQDIRLSLAGFWLGRSIRNGRFKTGQACADYIASHLQMPGVSGFPTRFGPLLKRHLGAEVGEKLARDPEFFTELRQIDPNRVEATASIAGLIYARVQAHFRELHRFPTLYSNAIRLTLDPDFQREMRGVYKSSCVTKEVKSDGKRARHLRVPSWIGTVVHKVLMRLKEIVINLLRHGTLLEPVIGDDEVLPVRSAPLTQVFKPGEKLTLYVGLGKVDMEEILKSGLLSPCERRFGYEEAQRRIMKDGEAASIIASDSPPSDDNVLYVSTSVSRRIAQSFSIPGGYILKLKVPAEKCRMLNDPQIWASTPLRNIGCIEHYLHEVLLQRVEPAWIESVQPCHDHRTDVYLARHYHAVKKLFKAVFPMARAFVKKLRGRGRARVKKN